MELMIVLTVGLNVTNFRCLLFSTFDLMDQKQID